MINKKPKIFYLDYETCSLIGKFYGSIWQTNITKVLRNQQIISGSGCWDDGKVFSVGQDDFKGYKKGVFNDYEIVKYFAEESSKADFVVAQNGDAFDIKVLNSRIAFYGLPAIPDVKTFDTKKLTKNAFYLPSYSLKNLAEYFGIKQNKIDIRLTEVEDRCEQGDKSAWAELKRYGKRDSVVLREVFKKILPYVKFNSHQTVFSANAQCSNPLCLSHNLGVHYKKRRVVGGWKTQYQCKDCGRYTTSKVLDK
jgi:DNA polymerase elongation subunit (family B)